MSKSWPAASLGDAIVRVVERTAIAAEALVGRGDEQAADLAAALAMRNALQDLEARSRIVVGDPDVMEDYELVVPAGLEVGPDGAPEIDVAIDPIEGVTIAAKAKANAIATIAAAPRGGFMATPNVYMEKLAVGPGHDAALLDLDAPIGEIATRLAKSKGVDVADITACVLDRPRHEKVIGELRAAGARVNLIGDGDVAAVIQTALPTSRVDLYAGQGGAAEGVLAAAALKCVGGQMRTRLVIRGGEDHKRLAECGIDDPRKVFGVDDLVSSDTIFAATGITRGPLLDGVVRTATHLETDSIVMTSHDGILRRVRSTIPRNLVSNGQNG